MAGSGGQADSSDRAALLDAEPVQRAEVAAGENVEREAPAFLVRFVRVHRMRDDGRKQANVVRLRLVAPAFAVVDVEAVDIQVERRRERNEAQNVPVKYEIAAPVVRLQIEDARDQRVVVHMRTRR